MFLVRILMEVYFLFKFIQQESHQSTNCSLNEDEYETDVLWNMALKHPCSLLHHVSFQFWHYQAFDGFRDHREALTYLSLNQRTQSKDFKTPFRDILQKQKGFILELNCAVSVDSLGKSLCAKVKCQNISVSLCLVCNPLFWVLYTFTVSVALCLCIVGFVLFFGVLGVSYSVLSAA